mmetsp:Transcript_15151/g.44290  ORF Transcript_15151/g.44290 Transcript_15151/m.44290 type:complete len:239 (-) Transcript_15151:12-728(-)
MMRHWPPWGEATRAQSPRNGPSRPSSRRTSTWAMRHPCGLGSRLRGPPAAACQLRRRRALPTCSALPPAAARQARAPHCARSPRRHGPPRAAARWLRAPPRSSQTKQTTRPCSSTSSRSVCRPASTPRRPAASSGLCLRVTPGARPQRLDRRAQSWRLRQASSRPAARSRAPAPSVPQTRPGARPGAGPCAHTTPSSRATLLLLRSEFPSPQHQLQQARFFFLIRRPAKMARCRRLLR